MVGKSSNKRGNWNGEIDEINNDKLNGKIPKWIREGINYRFMKEDLIDVARGLSAGLEVTIDDQNYEKGTAPRLYVVFEDKEGVSEEMNKLSERLHSKGLIRHNMSKSETPYSNVKNVKVMVFAYNPRDYSLIS